MQQPALWTKISLNAQNANDVICSLKLISKTTVCTVYQVLKYILYCTQI